MKFLFFIFNNSDSNVNDGCCRGCQVAARGLVCFTSQTYTECYNSESFCDGKSKSCPSQSLKPAGTSCFSQDYGKCDSGGRCLSLCQQLDIRTMPCLCESNENACMQCCQPAGGKCMPIHELTQSVKVTYLTDGRPCKHGTCLNVIILKLKF